MSSLGNFLAIIDPQNLLPFEDLFIPLVLRARAKLSQLVNADSYQLLSRASHEEWERYLLVRLTSAGSNAAMRQFEIWRTVRTAFPGSSIPAERGSNALYRQFVGDDPAERLQRLFAEFEALESICVVLVRNWISAVIEFLERLAADRNHFELHFPALASNFLVSKLEVGLGDPHRGGRSVVRLIFDGGCALIYKPRSLAPEAHFSELLDHCNEAGIIHLLRSPRCWPRGQYGWMENIESGSCTTAADVRAFYWRAGALLGLIYLSRGVDCHRGNLIAAGEFPVLIDLEALWHLQMPDANAASVPSDSLLRTGFLPRETYRDSALYQWSGLSWTEHATRPVTTWIRTNQDDMSGETRIRDARSRSHLPILDGEIHLAPKYVPEIQAGFRCIGELYLSAGKRRKKLERWVRNLAVCPRRRIFRPTLLYQLVLRNLTLPKTLRNERMVARLFETHRPGNGPPLTEDEAESLAQMDIPYFEQDMLGMDHRSEAETIPSRERYLAQANTIARSLLGTAAPIFE